MRILYLGDNAGSSAEYLKDCLRELEHEVEHVDSAAPPAHLNESFDAIILSDYPAAQLGTEATQAIESQVAAGSRGIMLGGWDSFNGRGSNYANHPVADLLPVRLQENDDRVNAPQGLILSTDAQLETAIPLDWQNPPTICGYNAVEVKAGATPLVWARPIQSDGKTVSLLQPQPLVVKHAYKKGTVTACMTDLAPHWCGGLVDWGSQRRSLPHVEVGEMYVQFIRFLLEA